MNTDIPLEDVAEIMGRITDEGIIGGWGLSQVSLDQLKEAHSVYPVTAVQNIYSKVERDLEHEIIPFCIENGIGVVPFSPIASGLLSGKVTASTDFSHSDDVRKFVPQLKPGNIEANQPIVDLLRRWAGRKDATPAQISLAWMLRNRARMICMAIRAAIRIRLRVEKMPFWLRFIRVSSFFSARGNGLLLGDKVRIEATYTRGADIKIPIQSGQAHCELVLDIRKLCGSGCSITS